MNAFAAAMDVLAADPNLGEEAIYRQGGTGAPVAVRMLRSSPDRTVAAFGTDILQATDILAVAISDEDHVYVWYKNGYASWGTSDHPGQHGPYAFASPLDPDRDEIIGIDIANGDVIYAWYETGRASQGTSSNLSSTTTYDIRGRGITLGSNSVLSPGDIEAVEAMY